MSTTGKQLEYNCPYFYDSHMPGFTESLPSLYDAIENDKCTTTNRSTKLTTIGGQKLISFAKSRKFDAGKQIDL